MTSHHDRIIFALDVSTRKEAYEWCSRLEGKVGFVKIGLELFTSFGPDIIDAAASYSLGVMIDLKLHDIPNTVGSTVEKWLVKDSPVRFITIHASGGLEMMKRARSDSIAAVTVLTSLDREECVAIYGAPPSDVAMKLATRAVEAGIKTLVCSGHEVKALRARFPDVRLIVPGVRPLHAESHDQKRIVTPQEAIANGASFLVVGRFIREARSHEAACDIIADGIAEGFERRTS